MNREIKFRAWDKENKCFWRNIYEAYKGSLEELSINLNGRLHIRNISGMHDESTFYDRFELMQYTGLKDKNGKEIYEGDIIKEEQGDKFIVKFGEFIIIEYDERQYGYYAEEINKTESEIGLTGKFPLFKWGCAQSIVIGNIHENPELLKAQR